MNEFDLDPSLESTARRIATLSRQVECDPEFKGRLRAQLLQRHQAMTSIPTPRTPTTWKWTPKFRRLAVVAAPALSIAIAVSVLIWALQVSGQQSSQTVEAARLQVTRALVRTIPTVTSWQMTLRQQRRNANLTQVCRAPGVGKNLHLYMWASKDVQQVKTYMYLSGTWYLVTPQAPSPKCHAGWEWQWPFAGLPLRLGTRNTEVLNGYTIHGQKTQGFRQVVNRAGNIQVTVTAWVDKKSGLVLRFDRMEMRGQQVVESDSADYEYMYRARP